jgi:WbqC-like protein family
MIVSIHQPNYIPWLGYFYKIWASDAFVLHDNVEYTKQSFTKRVFIRKEPNKLSRVYLSVPLKKHSDFALIRELEICHIQNWQQKHLNKIYYVYHKAPFFKQYYPVFQKTIESSQDLTHLADLNKFLIFNVLDILGIDKPIHISSQLPIKGFKADEYNAEIVRKIGGDAYMSGVGAKKYQAENTYSKRHISLIYNNIGQHLQQSPPQYPTAFDASLSILDALFFIGEDAILQLFHDYQETELAFVDMNTNIQVI